jgi:hypothetical protein
MIIVPIGYGNGALFDISKMDGRTPYGDSMQMVSSLESSFLIKWAHPCTASSFVQQKHALSPH